MINKILGYILLIRFVLLFLVTLFFTLMAFLFFWSRYTSLNIDYYLMYLWGKASTLVYGIKRSRSGRKGKKFVGVYVAPHSSLWDIIILGSEFNGFFVSKAEVLKWPVIGLGARFVRTVFINRDKGVSAIRAMERSARKVFDSKNSLIVFPEGTRSFDHMKPLKSGPFYISHATGRPIKPVIIQYYPRESVVPRRKGNFIIELLKQSMDTSRVRVDIKELAAIDPKKFKSANELKTYVFNVMDKAYSK